MINLPQAVYQSLVERGYGMEHYKVESVADYNRLQMLKALEEFGEIARYVFDGQSPPESELADACIPLLAMFHVCGYNFEKAVLEKATNDIKRGRRDVHTNEPVSDHNAD